MKNIRVLVLLFLITASVGFVSCGSDLFGRVLYASGSANEVPVPEEQPEGYEKIDLTVASGNRIVGWLKPHENAAAPVIVYFHGNAVNIARMHASGFYDKMSELGAHAIGWDYPSYGLSTGEPTQTTVLEGGQAVIDWARQKYPNSKIALWGRSLGTGPASLLMETNQDIASNLILTSPWNSAWKLIKAKTGMTDGWCKKQAEGNEYESEKAAQNIHKPVLIHHGTEDKVIKFALGEDLSKNFPEGVVRFVALEGKGHNDLFVESFWEDISNFLK